MRISIFLATNAAVISPDLLTSNFLVCNSSGWDGLVGLTACIKPGGWHSDKAGFKVTSGRSQFTLHWLSEFTWLVLMRRTAWLLSEESIRHTHILNLEAATVDGIHGCGLWMDHSDIFPSALKNRPQLYCQCLDKTCNTSSSPRLWCVFVQSRWSVLNWSLQADICYN